ncbi:MAG: histidinol-phosphatase [Spirochaetes bacterium]|nr:MAG: histidinol-phosphatase [Spirochaetota bacterium]
MVFKTDLHIHSTLSPCGSLGSSPQKIVAEAARKELDIIAVSDHNSTRNLPAFKKAADGKVIPLFGIEVQTISETHILVIFDKLDAAMSFGDIIFNNLPETPNNPEYFGDQVVVDENETILDFEERLLLQSVSLNVEEVCLKVHSLGGLAFPAHIDRDSFSILSQLGYIPENLPIDGIEISSGLSIKEAGERFPEYFARYPVIRNSDAHYIQDIGSFFTFFEMEEPSLSEIKQALLESNGRRHYFDA